MKTLLAFITASLLSVNAFAMEKPSFERNTSVNKITNLIQGINPDTDIISVSSADKKAKKKWTVMMYVNTKNDLESNGLADVNEMEMIGSSNEVNIVAEVGRIEGHSTAEGDWKTTRRYLLQKDDNPSLITSRALMEFEKTDMGDWKRLVDFAKWSMEKFPAERYMLMVWNHGSGWRSKKIKKNKGISYDYETSNHISTRQMKLALAEIGKVDIFAMDACRMQTMEVAYEIRDYADYIVASEENEPMDGYTYDTFLGPLIAKPAMTPEELAKTMVDSYVDHYVQKGPGANLSSIKASSLSTLKTMLDEWVNTVINANDREPVRIVKFTAQSFYYTSSKDLYHFLKLVAEKSQNPDVINKSNEIVKFMTDEVISYSRTHGKGYRNVSGLAIYFPNYLAPEYDDLQWAKDSAWDEFINWRNASCGVCFWHDGYNYCEKTVKTCVVQDDDKNCLEYFDMCVPYRDPPRQR